MPTPVPPAVPTGAKNLATNIYPRGTIHWWRRSVTYRSLDIQPITVRLSLRTGDLREAKARAAFLETELGTVETVVEKTLRTMMTQDDLKAVYHLAFTAALDRYIVKQASTPMFADAHAVANLAYARYFTLLAEGVRPPEANEELCKEMSARGLMQQDADALFAVVGHHRAQPPVGPNHVAQYLRDADVKPTETNMSNVSRVVASAYRNACLQASAEMGRPIPDGLVWPLAGGLDHMLGIAAAPCTSTVQATPRADVPTSSDMRPSVEPATVNQTTTQAYQPGPLDLKLSELASRAIAHKTASKEWRDERARDVNAMVALFIAANGDLLSSQTRQHHVSAMTALFPRLPTRYGHVKSDVEGGIAAAVQRGDALRARWAQDAALAEREKLPTVGLSAVTHNKHLSWLNALSTFAEGHGYVVPAINPSKARAKVKKTKGSKRPPWVVSDLHTLFRAPIWSGCAGLWKRFEPGNEIIHDGAYWAPLLIATSLGRSEEPNGLMLDDVFEDAPVPFVWFRDNPYRLLKNGQSDRKLPLSPKLIDLGFLDYIREMRRLGHELLFPEMNGNSGFDHEFYDKVFEPLRRSTFPDGTSGKIGRKDVDVHSIRTRGLSLLRDLRFDPGVRQYLGGHVPDGETAASYEEDPSMEVLLPLVVALGDKLLPAIKRYPLRLRPKEWQKPGAPRGRPASRS